MTDLPEIVYLITRLLLTAWVLYLALRACLWLVELWEAWHR